MTSHFIAIALATAISGASDPCRPQDPQRAAERHPTLEAYLAARAKAGRTDAPHYRRRADGRYVCVTWPKARAPAASFSREELERAYGFAARERRIGGKGSRWLPGQDSNLRPGG